MKEKFVSFILPPRYPERKLEGGRVSAEGGRAKLAFGDTTGVNPW